VRPVDQESVNPYASGWGPGQLIYTAWRAAGYEVDRVLRDGYDDQYLIIG
jgi:hypothetical protein